MLYDLTHDRLLETMLYSPKWDKPSLPGFIAWLKQQNPDEQYWYLSSETCAIGQYLTSIGTSYSDICKTMDGIHLLTHWNAEIARPSSTFGAALERAKKLQALAA